MTLAEEVQWEENQMGRILNKVVPPAPELEEIPKRGLYVTLVTLFFVAVYVAGSAGYLWELDERQERRLKRRWEDQPSTLEVFTKEKPPEPWTRDKYTERNPYWPLPDKE